MAKATNKEAKKPKAEKPETEEPQKATTKEAEEVAEKPKNEKVDKTAEEAKAESEAAKEEFFAKGENGEDLPGEPIDVEEPKPSSIILPNQKTYVPNASQKFQKPLHVKKGGEGVFVVVDNNGREIRVYDKRDGIEDPKGAAETFVRTH